MAKSNKSIMNKADMIVDDLKNDGGYLQSEQAKKFIKDLIKEATILRLATVYGMKSHTRLIDKIGINGRVLRPGHSGRALGVNDRTKPTTSQTTLTTVLCRAEMRLNDEVLEDNIEGGSFKNTVMSMFAEHISLDIDDMMLNGDTTSSDDLLALFDGARKLAVTNTVNVGDQPIDKTVLKKTVKAMPSQYNRNRAKQRFLTSEDGELEYRDYLADRATVLGDKFLQDEAPVRYASRALVPVPVMPDNTGTSSKSTDILLTDPKNMIAGFWRKVKVETDRDITAGEWIMVASVRLGFQWMEERAVVKAYDVRTQE